MNKSLIACASLLAVITSSADQAQAQVAANATDDRPDALSRALLPQMKFGFESFLLAATSRNINARSNALTIKAAAPGAVQAVRGSGTIGFVPKWVGITDGGQSILGDSVMSESAGNIG